ncbi:MAG: nuclear transport factor 2 family protein [Chloroflexi bacterium]|nr:nuclear transport factor 2 family protein [Chloroflexota bacterium]
MNNERYEQFIQVAEAYMHALNSLDVDAYLALFASDSVVRDPYGVAEFVGESGLRKFFDGMLKTWQHFEMRADNFYPGGADRLAMRWSVSATAKNGKTAEFSGVNVFTFDGDTLASLDGYWHMHSMLQQIRGD